MDAKNIQFLVEKAINDFISEVNDRLPRKVGTAAVNHFRQNIHDAGFRNNGIRAWQRTRRQGNISTHPAVSAKLRKYALAHGLLSRRINMIIRPKFSFNWKAVQKQSFWNIKKLNY